MYEKQIFDYGNATPKQLDIEIAKRLGWTCERYDVAPQNAYYQLITPIGEQYWHTPAFSEDEAWIYVPFISANLGLAWKLFDYKILRLLEDNETDLPWWDKKSPILAREICVFWLLHDDGVL